MEKTKVICMIPVRLGSTRVPKKNLRMIAGKPLVAHIIEAAKISGVFDEIYLNSESDIFEEIAKEYGIKFYKRPEHLSSDEATNDSFLNNFLQNIPCSSVIQLLSTSPFISAETIRAFTFTMFDGNYESLISVNKIQIECLYEGSTINFRKQKHTEPSQKLSPVLAYACGIMGYDRKRFLHNFENNSGAYHGAVGKTGYFTLTGYETVDIDREEDFILAEAIFKSMKEPKKEPEYYGDEKNTHSESNVPEILVKDGVELNDLHDVNKEIVNIHEIIAKMPTDKSWSKRLVNTESNSCTLICQNKNEGNRLHKHNHWNEWWRIEKGSWNFIIEGEEKKVKEGDVVFIAKGKKHRIQSLEDNSIRLAVSREDVPHVYIHE